MMDKNTRKKRLKDQAFQLYHQNMLKLSMLESSIQKQVMEFTAETGIQILDIQLYDSQTGEIQFDVNI